MAKKIVVNQEKCVGCGACVTLCPEVFEMTEDGKSQVKNAEGCEKGCEKCDCEGAIEGCPAGAIAWEE